MVNLLQSVKDYLGIEEDDTSFDGAISGHIDMSVFTLGQILTETPEYTSDTDAASIHKEVLMYIKLSTKLLFDPSASATVQDAITKAKNELEWRMSVATPYIE
jgi:hypothetical protein|nr:MAG TPA: hypothetical protein [Caudoviricetes sp.]